MVCTDRIVEESRKSRAYSAFNRRGTGPKLRQELSGLSPKIDYSKKALKNRKNKQYSST